jgi:sulfur relay (sulfurtransferase) DsrC/TusE family protein
MKTKTKIKAGTLTLDEDGFIQEPERWNDDVKAACAK